MSFELSEIDRRLLDHLQREVPLTPQPYREIGAALDLPERAVLERVAALAGSPSAPIRQISAIFDSKTLGYQSCLIAAKVDPAQLDAAAAVINAHPGVSHNYQRVHDYSLWFTLAVPPDSAMGLSETADVLRRLSGADQVRLMPAIRLFKIGVKFDLGVESAPAGDAAATAPNARGGSAPFTAAEADKRMIRVLQQHLPITARPFDAWAEAAEASVEQLLAAAERYRALGVMRRFSAVLRHREIGVSANAMGVWVVPPEQREAFGNLAAQEPAVSHCYERPTYPDWPYSVFTMVHGRTRGECESTLASLSRASGIGQYASLYSIKEYKKVRVRYFDGAIERWEREHQMVETSAARPW